METTAQLDAVQQYTIQKLSKDATGHGLDHIQRVVRMAKQLAAKENLDPFIPTAAAYLHDTIDEKLVDNVHDAKSELREFLRKIDFTQDQIQDVMDIIENMSFASTLKEQRPQLSPAGQIVQDADWLDAIGAIGVTRAIYYGGSHAEKIYDPKISPRQNMTRDEYRNLNDETIINHFYEKLLKIKDMLNTTAAKKVAEHRQKFMEAFLDEFKNEWEAKA